MEKVKLLPNTSAFSRLTSQGQDKDEKKHYLALILMEIRNWERGDKETRRQGDGETRRRGQNLLATHNL